MITALHEQDGASRIAANCAISFAQLEAGHVLLIDANMRDSSLHATFGVERFPGLSSLLAGRATLSDVIRPASNGNGLGATTDTTLHAPVYGPGERLEPGRGVEIFWTDWWERAYGRCPIDSGIRFAWGTEGGEPCLMIENDVPIYERVPTGSPVQVFYDRYDCP